jgi:[protein-PII] uridylyltransferase
MPAKYRDTFDVAATREHAALVDRRAGAPAHVEIWRRLPHGGAIICVVADDRPGLLALITASLAASGLDVLSAQAYTRALPHAKGDEAVDFWWLRRQGAEPLPIGLADASRVAEVLRGLITGTLEVDAIAGRAPSPPTASRGSTRVAFSSRLDAGNAVLTVDAPDRPGLLLAITLALFRARVQILGSRANTKRSDAADSFTVAELDGTVLSGERRRAVESAVMAALDGLGR